MIRVYGAIVRWIEVYKSIVIFSIAINRESYGFFPSSRGL